MPAVDSCISLANILVADMKELSMHILIIMQVNNVRRKLRALIDSGVQKKFIDKLMAFKLN